MASVLRDSFGEEKFRISRKNGPIAFFGDYMRVVKTRPGQKKFASFTRALERQVADWEKDWNKTYPDYVRRLVITPATNFDEVGGALKKIFSGASFTKDFSEEFAVAARYFLEKDDVQKALSILNLDRDLYPGSASPYAALGAAYIWTGNFEAARENYQKAVGLDPAHPQVSPGQIVSLINQLRTAKKMREALETSLIFIDFFPKDARLYLEAGNSYALSGQREKAIGYYKKALELDPNLAAAKSNLEKLEKIK
jgi:tetratricopeptide (TPR) repeat protein